MSLQPDTPFTVATYNVRVDAGARTPALAWSARRAKVAAVIRQAAPDLLGTQEALGPQVRDLADALPSHRWVGTGRDGEENGEYMALFYRPERFALIESSNFWLSDIPDRPSATWGNRYRRMVTWARFHENFSGRECVVANTHFDHESEAARTKGADLLRRFAARWPDNLPVVVTGDFNAEAGHSTTHAQLTGDGFFRDAWEAAAERRGDVALDTFNDFQPPRREARRIDWILLRGPVRADSIEIVNDTDDGCTSSDHFPVVARLAFA